MDEELPYKILKIMRDIYNKDPTGYMGMDYFEPELKLPEEVIQGALIYLKEKEWIRSFQDHGEWVQRINAKGMDELLNYENEHADDNEPLEFEVSHEDHTGKIKVFISHKFVKSDQKLAQTLENYLEQHNIYGYLAERKKEYDVVFGEKIKKEIESSDYVVAIITKNSHFAPSVHQEIGYAMGIRVPVRIMAEGQEAKGVLVEGKDIEKFSRQNFEKSLVNIIKDIQKNEIPIKINSEEKFFVQKSAHFRYELEQILANFIDGYLVRFVKEYAKDRGLFTKEQRIQGQQLFKNEIKNQDEFFRKLYKQTLGNIEIIYEDCNQFKIRYDRITRFPHVDFFPDEQDALIKINERVREVLADSLPRGLHDESKERLDLNMTLEECIVKIRENTKRIFEPSVYLMDLRFFLKSVESMFEILQTIHEKYGHLAFQSSYDDETV